jgi:voltage-gated potassium channel
MWRRPKRRSTFGATDAVACLSPSPVLWLGAVRVGPLDRQPRGTVLHLRRGHGNSHALARRHWHYVRTNLLSLLVVVIPPVRVIFSLRLIRSVFRRGHLARFVLAAAVLLLNGAIVVYFFERDAKGSNIHTLGQSVWWAVTTVSTVGYGDYFPVSVGGRITASLIMAIGILTIAVITAQVASSFVAQAARPAAGSTTTDPDSAEGSVADLARRLARIEALLRSTSSPPE